SAMSIGGAVGASLTGVLLERMSWRLLFALYALPGVLWAAWFYLWFRDRPQDLAAGSRAEPAPLDPSPDQPAAEKQEAPPPPTPWGAIFTSPAMAWICGQQFFR